MRAKVLFFLLLFNAVTFLAFAGQGDALFAQAVQKYQSGDYSAAVVLNERILKEVGVESAAVYFNLGNSYFKAGALGRAIINYCRAERASPRDGDIRANLAFARQAVDQADSGKPVTSVNRWFGVFSSLSSGEFKWLALCALMLTGMVCLWCLYAGLPSKRVILWTGLATAIAGYILIAFSVHYFDLLGRAVILTRTEARFEPSTQATVYFKLPEGAEIKILRSKDGWIKVQRNDGRSGWVPDNTAGAI